MEEILKRKIFCDTMYTYVHMYDSDGHSLVAEAYAENGTVCLYNVSTRHCSVCVGT